MKIHPPDRLSGLSAARLQALLEGLRRIYAAESLDGFSRGLVNLMPRIIPADLVGLTEVNPRLGRVSGVMGPGKWPEDEVARRFERVVHEHPVVAHFRRSPGSGAKRLSDFLSRRAYHRLALYREFYREFEVEYQLAANLAVGGDLILGVVLNRRRRDFTDTECVLLDALCPVFLEVYRNIEVLQIARLVNGGRSGDAPKRPETLGSAFPANLTKREMVVLHWVTAGKTNSEIARILSISLGTVKKHLEHIFAKLGVENRTAAARTALECGWDISR